MLSLSSISSVDPRGQLVVLHEGQLCLQFEHAGDGLTAIIKKCNEPPLMRFPLCQKTESCRFGKTGYLIVIDNESVCLRFVDDANASEFHRVVYRLRDGTSSVFSDRTDESSASQYFQFYGYLSQQQNMLQDFIRTSTYQKAIISNYTDFVDKVVLDVGAGSGILSFFAAQAGAKRVYAVEASSMANHARVLVSSNGLDHTITVVAGKIEELVLPEKVDVIVSEPMGYMLINERMLETYLHAKKFLKPGGKMFPCQGDLHIAPFQDEALYTEQFNKSSFWYQNAFHNVDLRCLREAAQTEYFGQPIVDTFDIRICTAKSVKHTFDFLTADESSLHNIEIPLHYEMLEGGSIHGLAFWFDVLFSGSLKNIWLSTCPTEPLTHWYQVRCLFENPLFVNAGDIVNGFVKLVANKRQSYDVTIQLQKLGTDMISTNTLDLKNPNFRYTGTAVSAPPGANTTSPSDVWWSSVDEHVSIVNGSVQTVPQPQVPVNGDVHISDNNSQSQHVQVQHVQPAVYGPLIHPGSISSTGRQRIGGSLTPTSTQQAQLIGGGISPTLFTSSSASASASASPSARHLVSHYPVSNNLMIGDYVATGIPLNVSASGRQ